MKKTKAQVLEQPEGRFKINLNVGDKEYNATGNSIGEALKKINPTFVKGMASVTLEVDGKKSKLPIKINPTKLEIIFKKPVELALFAKRLITLI